MSCTWCSVRHKEEPAVTYFPLSSFYSPLSSSPLLHLLFLLRSIVIFTLDFHLQMHSFQVTLFLTFASFLSFSIYLSLFLSIAYSIYPLIFLSIPVNLFLLISTLLLYFLDTTHRRGIRWYQSVSYTH